LSLFLSKLKGKSDWHKKGITALKTSASMDLDTFHKYYQVVFLDSTGNLNVTSRMSKYTFLKLKHDAQISLNLLNDEFTDNFDELFIKNHYLAISFDCLVK
jgi:hypothetical protein